MMRCCDVGGQFDVDSPPDDALLIPLIVFAVAGVAVLACVSSCIFICWWSACRRPAAHHADPKAYCPGISHPNAVVTVTIRLRLDGRSTAYRSPLRSQ